MRRRLIKLGAALAGMAALAVGGSALASAAHGPGRAAKPPAVQVVRHIATPKARPATLHPSSQATPAAATETQSGATDGDNVQQGDQTTADTVGEVQGETADTDNVQQGDQSAPDSATEQSDSQSEQASESGPSDGPGGYEDTSPNADTQQQGEH